VVAIPAAQGVGAGVFKKKLQRRRFDVAVAKYHVGFADRFFSFRVLSAFVKILFISNKNLHD
jgi:hypothetical protein